MDVVSLTDGVVVLDQHTLADADALLAGEDEEHARRFGWHPSRSTLESVRGAIERWHAEWESDGRVRAYAMRNADTGTLVGGCEIRVREEGIAELSYWVFPQFRGRGLASRAISLSSGWAYAELGVERMEIYVEPDNMASRRTALRAGFSEEGILRAHALAGGVRRDMVLYSRLSRH